MIRALPISARPVDGETSESYFGRLATANSVPAESLWGYLRKLHAGLPIKRTAELATLELEILGGIPPLWFRNNRQHHLLPIRCPHTRWKMAICTTCSRLPAPQSGCLLCGHGHATQVTTRTGPICLRHNRWHYDSSDVDITQLAGHVDAEKVFRRTLTARGISLETGELHLASELILAWEQPELRGQGTDGGLLLPLFPLAVSLAVALTDPEFVELLLSPRWSPSQHATLLSMTITHLVGHPERSDTDVLWQTVNHHARAVMAAYGMVGTRRRSRACTIERAFFTAAYTHRACLLRHLDAKQMPTISNPKHGRRAPSAQRLATLQEA
jgi:hypothetical protein